MGVRGHGMRGTTRKYREAGLSAGRWQVDMLGVCDTNAVCVWKP